MAYSFSFFAKHSLDTFSAARFTLETISFERLLNSAYVFPVAASPSIDKMLSKGRVLFTIPLNSFLSSPSLFALRFDCLRAAINTLRRRAFSSLRASTRAFCSSVSSSIYFSRNSTPSAICARLLSRQFPNIFISCTAFATSARISSISERTSPFPASFAKFFSTFLSLSTVAEYSASSSAASISE